MNKNGNKQNKPSKQLSYNRLKLTTTKKPNTKIEPLFCIDISHIKKEIVKEEKNKQETQTNNNLTSIDKEELIKKRPQTPTLKIKTLPINKSLNTSSKRPSINIKSPPSSYKDNYIKLSNSQKERKNNIVHKNNLIKGACSVPKENSNWNLLEKKNNKTTNLNTDNCDIINIQNKDVNVIINNYFIARNKYLASKYKKSKNHKFNNNHNFFRPYYLFNNQNNINTFQLKQKTSLLSQNVNMKKNNKAPLKLTIHSPNNEMVKFTFDILETVSQVQLENTKKENNNENQNNFNLLLNSNSNNVDLVFPNKLTQELIQKKNAMLNEILSKTSVRVGI